MAKTNSKTIGGENLEKAWKTFLGMIVVIVTLPITLPIFCIFYTIGESVKKYYRDKTGQAVAKARGMDGAFVHEVVESRPFINAYFTICGSADIKKIRDRFQTRILDAKDQFGNDRYHKFKQSIGRRYAYFLWRDTENFNIDEHIKQVDIHTIPLDKEPGDPQTNDVSDPETMSVEYRRLICRYLSTYGNKAMTKSKPQWEIIVFNRHDNKFTLLFRIHHALGDGVSLVRMFMDELIDTPIAPPQVGQRMPNIVFRIIWNLWALFLVPFGIWYLYLHRDYNALHGPKLSGKKVYRISNGIELSKVKALKGKSKATVNDVMMSCLSAALYKHYKRKSTPAEFTTIMIPVSLHDLQEPNVVHNKFAWAMCLLPSVETKSSLHRLSLIQTTMNAMKRDPLITAFYYVVRIVNGIFPAKIAEYLFYAPGITMVCSNVPGPQEKITVFGNDADEMTFMLPDRAPSGCGVAMFSYNGIIRPTIMVDRALLDKESDADDIMADLENEVANLEDELKHT